MDLTELPDRLDDLINFVENELPLYAERVMMHDLIALVTNRVVQTGKDHQGNPFKSYSTNPVPAYKYWGKSRNQSAEKQVRNLSRARSVLTYKDFRQLNNLKTNVKNFEFTGEMWKKFQVLSFTNSGGRFKVSAGGSTPAAQQKMDDNSQREGVNILEASQKEINIASFTAGEWLAEQADRILNS